MLSRVPSVRPGQTGPGAGSGGPSLAGALPGLAVEGGSAAGGLCRLPWGPRWVRWSLLASPGWQNLPRDEAHELREAFSRIRRLVVMSSPDGRGAAWTCQPGRGTARPGPPCLRVRHKPGWGRRGFPWQSCWGQRGGDSPQPPAPRGAPEPPRGSPNLLRAGLG